MLRTIIDILIAVGAIFAIAGTIGVIKMPDTFCRMQASTCITTLGVIGVCLGAILYAACIMHSASAAIKVGIIMALIITINPVGAHAIAKGAYRAGIRPAKKMQVDDFRRDFNE